MEKVKDVMKKLIQRAPDIRSYLVVRKDGSVVISKTIPGVDEHKMAAMAAAMLGISRKAVDELNFGELYQVIVYAEEGDIYVIRIEDKGLLAAVVQHGANSGLVLLEMERAAYKLARLL